MNRDGQIDTTDQSIVQSSIGSIGLIAAPMVNVAPTVVVADPIALSPDPAYTDFVNTSSRGTQGATVVGRSLYYNNSTFDGNNPAACATDDKVQDTGVFRLSAFVKLAPGASGYEALFNTNDGTSANSGFSFEVDANGSVQLSITDSNGNIRFLENSQPGLVTSGSWYQVAVVGNGAGNPVTFYITSASATSVVAYTSANSIALGNGDYATQAGQDLVIGASISDRDIFKGQMVDQAIYNRALSAAEIQQLFDYTKKS